ncbi:HD domain-containing phosphohydrolase [Aestuariispira insulae]|nr:HD domain-containing phosphohydrolase [Aestuariispira insulae]
MTGLNVPDRKKILVASPAAGDMGDVIPVMDLYYDVDLTDDAFQAIGWAVERAYHMIVLDDHLSGSDGYVIAQKMQDQGSRSPILMLAEEESQAQAGRNEGLCRDYVQKPFDQYGFLEKFWHICDHAAEQEWDELPDTHSELLKSTREHYRWITDDLIRHGRMDGEAIDACTGQVVTAVEAGIAFEALKKLSGYHESTYAHSLHTAALMTVFGNQIGLSSDDVEVITAVGFLHDVGKIRVPRAILDKKEPLTAGEWERIREHPEWSGHYIRESENVNNLIAMPAERHHERLDGSGYPLALAGGQIDDLSLAVAIVDIFAALTEDKPYHTAMSLFDALEEMRPMRGHQLESGFFDRFEEVVPELY